MMPTPDALPLEVYTLGLVDFEDAQRLQRRLVYDLGEGGGSGLVLCEHPLTISVGRSGSRAHIVPDDDELKSMGVRVHWVNRGGGCILHLPGQLAAYVAVSLEKLQLDLGRYLECLTAAVVGVLGEFDLQGSLHPNLPGLFLDQARVATIGVAVTRGIAYHGLTLNVGPFLEPFDALLDEPGIGGAPLRQTSMESRRQRIAAMAKVREAMIRHVELAFGFRSHHMFTQHHLIRRKVLAHAYAPTPG
jgi:lipoyl(octanoyl) transferase